MAKVLAAVLEGLRNFQFREFALPKVTEDDAVLRVEACGLCGTDHERLAIYVDGAAFHAGANLRRDRYIRTRLRSGSPPRTVVELTAADLGRGGALVAELART